MSALVVWLDGSWIALTACCCGTFLFSGVGMVGGLWEPETVGCGVADVDGLGVLLLAVPLALGWGCWGCHAWMSRVCFSAQIRCCQGSRLLAVSMQG